MSYHNFSSESILMEGMRKIDTDFLKRQIETLSAFIPDALTQLDDETETFYAVVLWGDISGVSLMSEKHMKPGNGGSKKLTASLNSVYGCIVDILRSSGGDILKFSTNTFLSIWKIPSNRCLFEVIHDVILASLFIQQQLSKLFEADDIHLKMKLRIACGDVRICVVGDEKFKDFVVSGTVFDELWQIKRGILNGDVVVALSAWGHVAEDDYEIFDGLTGGVKVLRCVYRPLQELKGICDEEKRCSFLVLCKKHLQYRKAVIERKIFPDKKLYLQFCQSVPQRNESIDSSSYRLFISKMKPFIPECVMGQIDKGQLLEDIMEIKDASIVCINILFNTTLKLNSVSIINSIFKIINKIIQSFSGMINNVYSVNNSIKVLLVFGLIKKEQISQKALKFAYQLHKSLLLLNAIKIISFAVTRGLVYCGIIGHPFRKHFLITGAAVNRARKMVKAFPSKLSCDNYIYNDCRLPSYYFQSLISATQDFCVALEYSEEFKERVLLEKPSSPLLGRTIEMELVHLVLNEAENVLQAICLHGKAKIGKTRILQEAVSVSLEKGYIVASVNLCGRIQPPYFSVCLLYKQLYDVLVKSEKQEMLVNYSRELWNLCESLETNEMDRRDIISTTLLEICALVDVLIVLIIDNVQYIDVQSYEVLTTVLSHKNVRFICGGQFEETTWNVRWRMALNKDIKVFEVQPLPTKHLHSLICNFLKVKGIDKKLMKIFENIKETRPGFLKLLLEAFLRNKSIEIKHVFYNEHKYIFPVGNSHLDNKADVVLAAGNIVTDENLTPTMIVMQLYDLFTNYQQMVVRIAAVIGEVFSRRLLLALLDTFSEACLCETFEKLFEIDVFDCATRYITCGGLVDTLKECYCNYQTKKCSHCKLIYFKDRNFRMEIYNMMLASERRELHLKIVDFIESQDYSCTKCMKNGSFSFTKTQTFKRFSNLKNKEEIIDKHIQESHSKISLKTSDYLWQTTSCFCLEIFIKNNSELIYHCQAGDYLEKQIFFIIRYSEVLMVLNENKEAIKQLCDALELCTLTALEQKLKNVFVVKIHLLLAKAYIETGNVLIAKKHLVNSLMNNNNIQITGRKLFVKAVEIFPSKLDAVNCISLLSRILAIEGQWNIAKAASIKSLKLLQDNSLETKSICDVFKNTLEIFLSSPDSFFCNTLEKRIRKEVFRKFSGNYIVDYYAVNDLINLIFKLYVLKGNLATCFKLGLRNLELNQCIKASFALFDLIPILATLFLFARRIEDAVAVIKILKQQRSSQKSLIIYYAFCIELNNETSLILEPIEDCLKFAGIFFQKCNYDLKPLEIKLIVNVHNYLLRNRRWHQADKWKNVVQNCDFTSFISVFNLIKETECSLLYLSHEIQMKKNFVYIEEEMATIMLRRCEKIAEQWKVFLPRVLHLKAYFYQLTSANSAKPKKLLKEASKIAKRQGNILEKCWIKLNESVWYGGFSFGNDVKNIDWKLEGRYTMEQWSQILYSLPLNTN